MGNVVSLAQFRRSKEEPATSEEQPAATTATTASKVTRKQKPKQDSDALPDRIFFRYTVEGTGLGVSRETYERAQRRQQLINENIEYDDFNYADYGPDPIKQEYIDWWARNLGPLQNWNPKKSKVRNRLDWRGDKVLAPLLDKRRKGSTLRKQLALLDETGDYKQLQAWLTGSMMLVYSDGLTLQLNNQILRAFARAGHHDEFIPVLARYAKHVVVGTDPKNSGPLSGTYFTLPIRPYYNP